MKNLIKYTSVCAVLAILLSSCGSNFSVTKRHYTSGYYIDYTKNSNTIIPKTEEKVAQAKTITPIGIAQTPVETNSVTPATIQSNAQNNPGAILSNDKKQAKANLRSVTKPMPINKSGVFTNVSKEDKRTLFEVPTSSNSISDDNGGDRALSLLWLVIVVILILWLIGILAGGFGLGGLINLLLLIALILLILWLLRII